MSSFVVLLALISLANGSLNFMNIYKGSDEMPDKEDVATRPAWKKIEEDKDDLHITWYAPEADHTVQLAYDDKKILAGVRLVIPKKSEDTFFNNSKIFEQKTIDEQPYYISTVILTLPEILRNGGRRTTEDDEIIERILVKHINGTYERIQRDACDNAKSKIFLEQGCKNGYGLVFLPQKKEDVTCDYPFFVVYNEEHTTGELLGFGWLAPASDVAGSKPLTEDDQKVLFRSAPAACIQDKTAVNIWLTKDGRDDAICHVEVGQFVKKQCVPRRRGGGISIY